MQYTPFALSKMQSMEKRNMAGRENKAAILAVSYGTSYNDSRENSIGSIERAIADRFPDYELRRAFTSQIMIGRLRESSGLKIDNIEEALARAATDGIRKLIVQPTHLMKGYEYTKLKETLKDHKDKFEQAVLGEPLLASEEDFKAAAKAVAENTAEYDDGETAVCLVGHGTGAASNSIYGKMQECLAKEGYTNLYVGTVKEKLSLKDIIEKLKVNGGYRKTILIPLMASAGNHAQNDMAGEKKDSWKNILKKEGYEVTCILEGLGQIPAIRDIYVSHVQEAVNRLEKPVT